MQWDESIIQQVWEKGRAAQDRDANEWRKDECGAWIHREQYQQEASDYGWRIRSTRAGSASPDDLHPFHIQNGYDIGQQETQCHVTADRDDIQPTASVDHPRNKAV